MDISVTKSAWLKALVGVAISTWAAYLCMTRFDWAEVRQQIRQLPTGVLFSTAAFYLMGFIPRAWRMSLMVGEMCKPTMKNSIEIVTIGYAVNNLLPFRIGELARADAAARRYGLHRLTAITQVATERLLDAMSIVALLLISLIFINTDGGHTELIDGFVRLASIVFSVGLVILIFVIRYERVVKSFLCRYGRFGELLNRYVIDTLACLGNGRRLGLVISASLLTWTFEAGSFAVLAFHWNMSQPILTGFFVMGIVNLSVLLPSAPGHIGVYHWAVILSLGGLAVAGDVAMSFAVVIHALQWVTITMVGSIFMACPMIGRVNKLDDVSQ